MKIKTLLITCFALVALVSCKSDDSGDDGGGGSNFLGTYTLVSIASTVDLDPNADGTFDDRELINNVNCNSSIILNSDDTFVWQPTIILEQAFINSNDYERISCFNWSVNQGDYVINDGSLVLNTTNQSADTTDIFNISEGEIEVSYMVRLIVSEGGVPTSRQVALVFKYSK